MFKFDFDIDEAEEPIPNNANPPNTFSNVRELENVTGLQAFGELPLNQLVRSKSASATYCRQITGPVRYFTEHDILLSTLHPAVFQS